MITTTFENKSLKVFYKGNLVMEQPFRPTSSGDKPEWQDEKEALDWLVTTINLVTAEQDEKDAFIASLNS
jgi:hypothetical protein